MSVEGLGMEFWNVFANNTDLFVRGFTTTLQLFAISGVASLILGTLVATLRVSPVPILRATGTVYVTLMRNTPLTLVFAFLVFAYPLLDVIGMSFFVTAVVALTLYTAAFVCEVVRSGINTVNVGQAEAARALGLTFTQTLGDVVLPQAIRSVVPPLASVLIALLKNTTIAAGFSVAEAGAIRYYLSERSENIMYGLIWVAIGFIVLVIPLTLLQRDLERRWRVAR